MTTGMSSHPATDLKAHQGPMIPPGTLRRLNYARAQDELAQSVAQQTRATLQQSIVAACEDIGLHIPEGTQVGIDWLSGVINLNDSVNGQQR